MTEHQSDFYRIQKQDIEKASRIFASAFYDDPIWKEVFKNLDEDQWKFFFQSPARYCRKFGKLYAPTENIEGMAGWTNWRYADMTFIRGLRCGSVMSMSHLDSKLLRRMQKIFSPLEKARKKNMKGKKYLYLTILGIAPEHQGKGYGSRLLAEVIEDARRYELPVYLETSTEKNVAFYEKSGFRVIDSIMHPIIDMPQWCMLRDT